MNTDHEIIKSPSLAEVKLAYKGNRPYEEYPVITNPQEAVEVLRNIWDEDTIELREEFVVLLLNNAKKCLGWCRISSGGATATIVDPASIFQVALLANATSIILAHNHPSGNPEPSQADITLTDRIQKAGKLLGLELEDHIILTASTYQSMRANNHLE